MGVKDLWTILTPFCDRRPLFELQGKTVAVDLSCWICEAQNISEYQVQPRMYLRNLYFRTCYLLLMEVNPVFVLEGKAPTLKYQTIAARNAIQFKGARPRKEGAAKTGKDRTRFNFTLRQCEEMLKYMGLSCVRGNGEAEAMCAYLNEDGLVDGCISQDSDCFAYGAQTVYRNFSISQQGAHAANGGAVDVYHIQKAVDNLGFGRNKIIALALLCGSDYSDGVHGIGKDSAMKLFEKFDDGCILERLKSWKQNDCVFDELYRKINNKNLCTACGHDGKITAHTKNGCLQCGMRTGCDETLFKEERVCIKNELNMRSKALADPDFPNHNLIKEFLERKDNVSSLNLKWKQPDMANFVKFTTKYLTWEEIYAFEKFLPILTRWQLLNVEQVGDNFINCKGMLIPGFIKKVRNPKGIPSYEVIWSDAENYYKNLIPKEQLEEVDVEKLWSTIEPQNLVKKAYPDLVSTYEQSKIKKPVKRKHKTKASVEDLENMLQNTSITEADVKKQKTTKKHMKKQTKTIDNYFKTAVLNNACMSTPKKPSATDSFDSNMSAFGDENCLDLSELIDDITSRKPPEIVLNKLKEIDLNSSSFFISAPIDNDLFEQSFKRNDSDDSFDFHYVPLYERIKMNT